VDREPPAEPDPPVEDRRAVLSFFLPAGPETQDFYQALGAGVEDHGAIDFGELEPVWVGAASVGRTAEERVASYEAELEAAVQAEIDAEQADDLEVVPNLDVEPERAAAPAPRGGMLEIAAGFGADDLPGESWTPTPDGSYVDDAGPESGYGWPAPAGRPAAAPAYPPVSWFGPATTAVVHVDDLDPAGQSEPMGVVLQWPPTRSSASNELPRSWSYRPAPASIGRASLSRWAMSDGARDRQDGRTIYQGQGQPQNAGLSLVNDRANNQIPQPNGLEPSGRKTAGREPSDREPHGPGASLQEAIGWESRGREGRGRANRGGRIYYGGNSGRARADIEGYERIAESLNRPGRRSRPNPLAEADANTTVYLGRHSAEPR
jgi:hypothetical protein